MRIDFSNGMFDTNVTSDGNLGWAPAIGEDADGKILYGEKMFVSTDRIRARASGDHERMLVSHCGHDIHIHRRNMAGPSSRIMIVPTCTLREYADRSSAVPA